MARIHPTACIDSRAEIADDAEIGPYCVIGGEVQISAGCRLVAHVHVAGATTIGEGTIVHPFAALGGPPQSTSYRGEATKLAIGANCDIRESVTMNIGTAAGGGITTVGDRCFFMANAHVAHDCRVGNDVVFANCVTLGGHCEVGDHVFLGGLVPAHQFVRIGAHAMIGGMSVLRGDVIPFGLVNGVPGRLVGINTVGMRRRGFSAAAITAVRRVFRILFLGPGSLQERLSAAEGETGDETAAAEVVAFVRGRSKRPLTGARRTGEEPLDDGA